MAAQKQEPSQSRYALLKSRTHAFCSAFMDLSRHPPGTLLSEHFTSSNPQITEHGPKTERLPFLGKTFSGRDQCLTYFDLLGQTLEFVPHKDTFLGESGIAVDDRASGSSQGIHGGGESATGVASVVGNATFKAKTTGRSWDEQFIWRLSEFDEEGKIGHWEIWADPLSAWLAVGDQGLN